MKFKEILNYLLEGRKIRRSVWELDHYWIIDDNDKLVNSIGENPTINKSQLNANDWEIVKESYCTQCGAKLKC